MLPKNKSYFAPELIIGGHYIITGLTTDNFIDDKLVIMDIKQKLHQELLAHDFDIVLFLDQINRLHCYDAKSFYLMQHPLEEEQLSTTTPQGTSMFAELEEDDPLGGAMTREEYLELETSRQASPVIETETLSLRNMSIESAWDQIIALLHQTRHRVGIVFPNISSIAFDFPAEAMEALSNIKALITDRPHSVFYIFNAEKDAGFDDYAGIGNAYWQQFFNSTIHPLYTAADADKNRVITLPTPNAAEIAKFLTRKRFNGELRFDTVDLKALSEAIAYISATEGLSLKALSTRISEYFRFHPSDELTCENYFDVLAVKKKKSAVEEINSLIGLSNVKKWINNWVEASKQSGKGRAFPESSSRFFPLETTTENGHILNVVFKGNPGTGKSTIAEQLGRLYYELGLLPRGHCIPCTAANLVSANVGQTAALVRQRVNEAMGGVLFIDEAYALYSNQHGREAIDQLVNDMTQYKGQFAVVICGYENQMTRFLAANPGLDSRFATKMTLEDYTAEEMNSIFRLFAQKTAENIVLDSELEEKFTAFCDNWANNHGPKWGNAREADVLLGNMKKNCLARLSEQGLPATSTLVLTVEDIPDTHKAFLKPLPDNVGDIIKELEECTIGLANVKKRMHALAQRISLDTKKESGAGRFIFHGPPGTGKTHMARLFANLLFRMGRIKRNFVYEVTAKQLGAPDPQIDYGKPDPSISEIIEKAFENAKNGVIFIDEAHQFLDNTENGEGSSILRALVPILDRPDIYENTCVILAGYTDRITALIHNDDGLERRFPTDNRIRFDNYTASELTALTAFFADKNGHKFTENFLKRAHAGFSAYLMNPQPNFGNAGFIRDTFVPAAIEKKSHRLALEELHDENAIATKEQAALIEVSKRSRLIASDIPDPFNEMALNWDLIAEDNIATPKDYRFPASYKALPIPEDKPVWEMVDGLVGKKEIKDYLLLRRDGLNEERFFDAAKQTGCHFAIVGPQGCGRHTAARAVTAALHALGELDRNEVTVTSKGDFEAGFVGQTVPKALGTIEKAKGGCMLVENPSSMLPKSASDNTFGTEALSTIGGAMTGNIDKLSVIFIETEEGFESFRKQCPEIVSNLTRVFMLEDLLPEEMQKLFEEQTKNSFKFDTETSELLPDFFVNWVSSRGGLTEDSAIWGNGKEIEKLTDELKNSWKKENGISDKTDKAPKRLIKRDMFPPVYKKYLCLASTNKETALNELNALTGLDGVKAAINAVATRIKFYGSQTPPGFYAFMGNPGTGKTMVARLFGGILKSVNALSQGHVIERTAKQLAANPESFEECLKLAKNGILFIDEAPQLMHTSTGTAIIEKLLTTVENADIMKNICIILAGYPHAMFNLFEYDSGLSSRFDKDNAKLYFEDYTPAQLLSIMDDFAAKADTDKYLNCPTKLNVSDEKFRKHSLKVFETAVTKKDFGNGRYVRNYLDKCVNRMLARVSKLSEEEIASNPALLNTLTADDIPLSLQAQINRTVIPSKLSRDLFIPAVNPCPPSTDPVAKNEYIENLKKCTVLIISEDEKGNEGSGSGAIITSDGHILTCAHVVENAAKVKAKLYTPGAVGKEYSYFDCTVLEPVYSSDGDIDMAVIKMEGNNFPFLPIRPADSPIFDSESFIITGFPLATKISSGGYDELNCSVDPGHIKSHQSDYGKIINYIDADVKPGNSGGPVISDIDGCIIGIVLGAIETKSGKGASVYIEKRMRPVTYFWERFIK